MRTNLFTCLLLAGLISFAAACSDKKSKSTTTDKGDKESTFDLTAAKKAIDEGNQSLMDFLKKGDSTGFASMYASDAKVMPPNMPAISGKEGIVSLIGAFVRMGVKNFNLKTMDIWGSESLIGEEGEYNITDDAGKESDHGKYIVLWKMEDGKWKLFRDCWNSDLPCPK
jgi:ketosteroid isomerase-like protein